MKSPGTHSSKWSRYRGPDAMFLGKRTDFDAVARTVCAHYGITREEALCACRQFHLCWVRFVIFYICVDLSGNYSAVARHFGRANGSIHNAEHRVREQMDVRPAVAEDISALLARCKGDAL